MSVSRPPVEPSQFVWAGRNPGNTPADAILDLLARGGADFNPLDTQLFVDSNGNGVRDAGEPVLTPGQPLPLGVGETQTVMVTFRAPPSTGPGDVGILDLTASVSGTTVADTSSGTAIIATTGLQLAKSAGASRATAGGELTYTLQLRNNGSLSAQTYDTVQGEAITVDGAQTAGVYVRDAIPLNTQLVRIENTINFTRLFHVVGEPAYAFVSTPPADLATVDAVAFRYPTAYPPSQSTDLAFTVRVNDNAANLRIENTGQTYQVSATGQLEILDSNPVETPVDGPAGSIRFVDPTFTQDQTQTPLDSNVQLQVSSAQCNVSPAVDQISVTVTSQPDGDVETITAVETGPNTGIFRTAALAVQEQLPAVRENGVLTGSKASRASASAICGGQTLTDRLTINAGGYVFNALSNAGVPGVVVILRDQSGAEVGRATTDETGFYQFSDVQPGTYSFSVVGLEGLDFPSQRTVLPGFNRTIEADGSYARPFVVGAAAAQFGFDLPVDPSLTNALVLSKTANKSTARAGDFVRYELELSNRRDVAIYGVQIADTLPVGFAFVPGSARLDGAAISDPGGVPGANLDFPIGIIGRNETVRLSYVARILPSAGEGDRTNVAVAQGLMTGLATRVSSLRARATVRVSERGGVFASQGVILGRIYMDCDLNRLQSGPNELGVPGVRVYTSTGRSVITDIDGSYSLPVVEARTTVIALDRNTLPTGARA
ncbi:MAG: SdrD B-like domain-containing protein, partial [Pseudomonadota bacterium]